nr:hypothetical protein [Tanacetum cinerariifolium]
MPLGDHTSHWSNFLGEIIKEFLMHYPSWHKIEAERKAMVLGRISVIEQHLAKMYTDNKSALMAEHWVPNTEDMTYDVEGFRSQHPANISHRCYINQEGHRATFSQDALDPNVLRTSPRQIGMHNLPFGLIPRTLPGVLKMLKTGQRARSYADRDPSHLLSSEICM